MMLGNRTWNEWIRQYSASHQNPINRMCHTFGIPMIVVSLVLVPLAVWRAGWWWAAGGLFVIGWVFQFVGHLFEGKPQEFFRDWRFLFVGVRWWIAEHTEKAKGKSN